MNRRSLFKGLLAAAATAVARVYMPSTLAPVTWRASVDGPCVGQHFDVAVMDDLVSPEHGNSSESLVHVMRLMRQHDEYRAILEHIYVRC